ncbi:MAG: phage protein Gp27 family protein, partial [Burkholderia contaminans]
MGRSSGVQRLPKAVREWLESALVEGNFTGYQELEQTLRDKGYQISKSAIHRYGQRIER